VDWEPWEWTGSPVGVQGYSWGSIIYKNCPIHRVGHGYGKTRGFGVTGVTGTGTVGLLATRDIPRPIPAVSRVFTGI
jgi:hypothetical protein